MENESKTSMLLSWGNSALFRKAPLAYVHLDRGDPFSLHVNVRTSTAVNGNLQLLDLYTFGLRRRNGDVSLTQRVSHHLDTRDNTTGICRM